MIDNQRWADFWERPHLARDPDPGEERRVIVDALGTIVAALSGRRDGGRFVVHGLRARPGAARELAAETAALAARVEVTLWSEDLDVALAAALQEVGFRAGVDVVRVERSLVDLPRASRLVLRREPARLRAMVAAALEGTRNRHAGDADALLAGAAEHGLVERWAVAYAGAAPVGVVLPVARRGRGSMGFVGLVPEWRGAGLARELLALGLAELAAAGCDRYADGTDVHNEPMWRTFAAVGCRYLGIEHTLNREDAHG